MCPPGIEGIADAIENPFEDDPSDLPLSKGSFLAVSRRFLIIWLREQTISAMSCEVR